MNISWNKYFRYEGKTLSLGSGFLDLSLWPRSWILGSGISVAFPWSWIQEPLVLGPRAQVFCPSNYSVIIAKCEKKTIVESGRYYKLWVITKCERKLLQDVTGITKCDDYYKIRDKALDLVYPWIYSCIFLLSKNLFYYRLIQHRVWNPITY